MKKYISWLLSLGLVLGLFAGCDKDNQPKETQTPESLVLVNPTDPTGGAEPAETDFSKTDGDMFTQRDTEASYDPNKAVHIRLEGSSATADSNSVQIDGSRIVLKEEAVYILSGSLTDGMILVDAPDTAKLQLVLDGVSVTSETSAALYIREADKVFVTLAEGSENTLANGGSFVAIDENNIDGALFSKQDLTLNGSGSLTVTAPGGHGIVCKDDLVITGGSYTINAASHGLDANDSVRLGDATVHIDAGKDAIHCENTDDTAKGFVYLSGATVKAEAEGDGIAASAYLQLCGGTVELLVGGGSENGTKTRSDNFGGFMGGHGGMKPGSVNPGMTQTEESGTSMKGLKAGTGLLISGGSITVNSADDAIHSDASLIINGGSFALASGDDAIHAEDTLTVTAGTIDISDSYEGLEALHIEVSGGDIKLVASDDGLNAAGGTDQSGMTGGRDGMFGGRPGGGPGGFGGMGTGSGGSILISGGTLFVNASGDGLDANGTLEISGGYTVVVGPTQGDTATLDYDTSGVITGGTFIGTGASGMAQTFSDSKQGVIAVSVGNQPAGTRITLTDAKGNTVIDHTPELSFAVVILSDPAIVKGEPYTITVGAQSGTFEAN